MAGVSEDESRISFTAPVHKTTNTPIQCYTWRIDRFSRVNAKWLYSDVFEAGGYKWRVLIFPKGNNVMGYLSMYLYAADSTIWSDGYKYAQISMTIVNQITNKSSVRRATQQQFNKLQRNWGFLGFIPLGVLFDPSRGYLVNDTLVVEVKVTCNVVEKDTAEHLWERLKKDREKEKHINEEKIEAHLYTIIKVVRDEDLAKQIGKDIYFNLVDHDKVRSFRVQNQTSFNAFKEEVAKEFGIPARFQQFWLWAKRLNYAYRPFRPLTHTEEAGPVGQFRDVFDIHIEELDLFLEVECGLDLRPIAPLKKTNGDILLFFKLYDPEREELCYVGRLFVNCTDKPAEILTKLNKLAGYDPDEEIELYEEMFGPTVRCLPVDKKLTFQESELENGDIIFYQKASSMDIEKHIRYPNVPSYVEYVCHRYPDVPSYLKYVYNCRVPFFSPSDTESKDEESFEEKNENIMAKEANVDKNTIAQQSKVDIETTHDEGWMAGGSEDESRTSHTAADDPSPFRFTWKIDKFSRMNTKKLYSEVFKHGGYKWRVLIFPKGNNVMGYMSLYLEVANSVSFPYYGWSRYAQFNLTVVSQIMNKYSVTKDTQHKFNARESDWGFPFFMPFGELFDPARGYLLNDTLEVQVEVTRNVDEKDTTEHLRERLKKDQEVKKHKNKEKAEAHLYTYTVIKVVRNEDLRKQIGKDIYFDLLDHAKVRSFRVQKQTSFNVFKEEVAKEFGIPARFQRFWLWAMRQNHTYRPFRPLTHIEEAGPVGQFRDVYHVPIVELELFLEVNRGPDFRLLAPLKKRKDDILLFFKLYDPQTEKLRYVGRLFVNCTDKPYEILTRLNQLAGYDPDEEILLYEEIKFEPYVMCEPVDKKLTFQGSELEDGDIICFQRASAMDTEKHIRYPDVPSYLEYVRNRYPDVTSYLRRVPFFPTDIESKNEESSEEQNENIIAEETNADKNTEAQQSKVVIETSHDEGTSKGLLFPLNLSSKDKKSRNWIPTSLRNFFRN